MGQEIIVRVIKKASGLFGKENDGSFKKTILSCHS